MEVPEAKKTLFAMGSRIQATNKTFTVSLLEYPVHGPYNGAPLNGAQMRRGAGVVERARLESECRVYSPTEGSNPSLSATKQPANERVFLWPKDG